MKKHIATVLAALGGLFIIYVGISYLVDPLTTVAGFGITSWPTTEGTALYSIKGDRDIAFGLAILGLLFTGHRRALGVVQLAVATAPFADMLIVLNDGGPAATAFGVHGLTAVLVAVTGVLLLTERRSPKPTAEAAA